MSKWTLVLAYQDCVLFEIIPAAQRLEPMFPVRVATPDGRSFRDDSGLTINPDYAYPEVAPDGCVCVLVPGGNPDGIASNPDVVRILGGVRDQGGIVAGICAGVAVLGLAGILAGRRIAHNYTAERRKTFPPMCSHTPIRCGEIRRTSRTASASTPALSARPS